MKIAHDDDSLQLENLHKMNCDNSSLLGNENKIPRFLLQKKIYIFPPFYFMIQLEESG